ncbi:MAG: plastocyanin/azurin family copper-binding protein, partial [Candidatus Nitrosopelagicus sp.]|nr:plastocyanin/azurin family copper-binding protein [Candidatus Nitrosopelagicus sp.]MDP6898571.1 plastocyanin/azurin family copper-binding protein [Candidatus Nitrosopelagicus sp.]
WKNQDDYGHTVQSQDGAGNVIPLFNSNILLTGQTFEYKFDERGDYQYFCTLHPWRVGTISVI